MFSLLTSPTTTEFYTFPYTTLFRSKSTLIIADGFSCREQIKSATDRRAMHLAQVIKMALDESSAGTNYPEQRYARKEAVYRSEERRVGKECRSMWTTYH